MDHLQPPRVLGITYCFASLVSGGDSSERVRAQLSLVISILAFLLRPPQEELEGLVAGDHHTGDLNAAPPQHVIKWSTFQERSPETKDPADHLGRERAWCERN